MFSKSEILVCSSKTLLERGFKLIHAIFGTSYKDAELNI